MTPLQHSVFRSVVCAALIISATTLTIRAQDTIDVKTFQGIQFERAEVPKSYISLLPPSAAITSYSLNLPSQTPTPLAILAVASDSANNYMYWYDGQTTTLEIISGTALRRPEDAMVDEDVAKTSHYSNNFQADVTLVNGTTGPRSTSLGGANNLASGSETTTGGGELNNVSGSTGIIGGGDHNDITGNDGAIWSGTTNKVGSTQCVILGGYHNETTGNNVFIGGGNTNNVASGYATVFGGEFATTSSAASGVIYGGYTNSNTSARAVVGGGTNGTASGSHSGLLGGYTNTLSAGTGFIGGGASNNASGSSASILGGASNAASGSYAAISGGQSNTASSNHAMVGGGQSNISSTGTHAVTLSGQSGGATAIAATTLGGSANFTTGTYSVALGRGMTVSASGILGISGSSSVMTVSTASTTALGNMNVWIASNEGAPKELRLFEGNSVSGAIESSTINYVSFKAPMSMYYGTSGTYTLSDRIGSAGQFMTIASSPTPSTTAGTIDWVTIPAYDMFAVNSTGSGAFGAGMDNADYIRVTSTGGAPGRIMTLRNGVTNGMVVTIRFSGANAIRLRDTDANLDLQGVADFDMDANDTLTLVWDAGSTKWIEIGRTVQN